MAEEEDLRSLELYNGESVELVSVERAPRPASQTAENITVVTSKDIEALNAHTLADVLYTITGVQLENTRTPGTFVYLQIQGSKYNHILVLIDDIPINILAENIAFISSIPVQMIERIEIVKGAASSSWGNALGGVINVITKSPKASSPFDGVASFSWGTRETMDGRLEGSGTAGRLGYYLTGGKLKSDGLEPNNGSDLDSFYGKLTYDLPGRGSLAATAGLFQNDSGQLRVTVPSPLPAGGTVDVTSDSDEEFRQFFASLSLRYPLADRLDLEATLRNRQSMLAIEASNNLMPGIRRSKVDESDSGVSLILSWLSDLQRVVGGVDYDHIEGELGGNQVADNLTPKADRVGVYLNDTFTLGNFAITPSARFDHTDSGGDLFSPSFGITYALTENTALRGYTARGYSITSLNRDDSTEKVWTSQVGVESSDIPYLWVKATVFRNDTWDVSVPVPDGAGGYTVEKQRELKHGYELELKTVPLMGTSFSLGYNYINSRNKDQDKAASGARHTLNLGVEYEDPRFLRALLVGHYIDWNGSGDWKDGKYDDMIWDLHLGKRFRLAPQASVELFASVRNIFNGDQYLFPYRNPRRWGEVGVRCEF